MNAPEKAWLRVIGDVHGRLGEYVRLTYDAQYTIQVGDCAILDYKYLNEHLDPEKHRVIAGNHDNYREDATGRFCVQTSHFLGDFGVHEVPGFGPIFFVRGGDSIDKRTRTEGKDWWPREQLSAGEMHKCMELYQQVRPNFVISHESPAFICNKVSSHHSNIEPSATAKFLERLFEVHQPQNWLFGHHHRDWYLGEKNCLFQCVGELKYVDFRKRK